MFARVAFSPSWLISTPGDMPPFLPNLPPVANKHTAETDGRRGNRCAVTCFPDELVSPG